MYGDDVRILFKNKLLEPHDYYVSGQLLIVVHSKQTCEIDLY